MRLPAVLGMHLHDEHRWTALLPVLDRRALPECRDPRPGVSTSEATMKRRRLAVAFLLALTLMGCDQSWALRCGGAIDDPRRVCAIENTATGQHWLNLQLVMLKVEGEE